MPGVVFLIVVPTTNFERELLYGMSNELPAPLVPVVTTTQHAAKSPEMTENNNGILRLKVELRDKRATKQKRGIMIGERGHDIFYPPKSDCQITRATTPTIVPLEKVLEELLVKLEIKNVTWTTSRKGYFHHVVFPLQSGEPCETALHCLTELGIGTKLNSNVSVLPCSVSYDAVSGMDDFINETDNATEDVSKWNNFVESIKSKLTVKQVVDGVRAGGSLSFDYLLLIITADSLAALGLVENNAPNITAAMLVSPLMGPVMSITFGAIISDKELMRIGFLSLTVGMCISCLFGFIFGLILGTTEMPWGSGDWPTEEMRGRGNARSLWMGILWALTSGTGVAVALLQGSAGPLIGVAISASLLPPVVNCGLFWALACIWVINPDKRVPHLKGEAYNETSAYPFLYTDYLPTEFLINGIVSCLLTIINVICIFITAIIVLKIKEVSAPYTASPDLKRFWETDLRTVRASNRQSARNRTGTLYHKICSEGLTEHNSELDNFLQQAIKEAEDDTTFKKVRRMSYSSHAAGERLGKHVGLTKPDEFLGGSSRRGSHVNSIHKTKLLVDVKTLDKLFSNLLTQELLDRGKIDGHNRKSPRKLSRFRPTSRSAHTFNYTVKNSPYNEIQEHCSATDNGNSGMPTIMESGTSKQRTPIAGEQVPPTWSETLQRPSSSVRYIMSSVANATRRLSENIASSVSGNDAEENLDLTENSQP